MFDRALCACLGLTLIFCVGVGSPVLAYKWPGDGPSPGGAISAKVIGQYCSGILSSTEIAELDAYLAKAASELAQKEEAKKGSGFSSQSFETFRKGLTKDYESKYRDPKACDADATEEARVRLEPLLIPIASVKIAFMRSFVGRVKRGNVILKFRKRVGDRIWPVIDREPVREDVSVFDNRHSEEVQLRLIRSGFAVELLD
jgi:hypothetical protein